jgi:hypothetical protein
MALGIASAAPAHAQYFGYGGYGYPGFGFGGYPGFGYGGYGLGYGGYGYPGYDFGYNGFGFGAPVAGLPYTYYAGYNSPYLNPLFGVGLTPLGAQSALAEIYLLGRGNGATVSNVAGGGSNRMVSTFGLNGAPVAPGYDGTSPTFGLYGGSVSGRPYGTMPTYGAYGGSVPGLYAR